MSEFELSPELEDRLRALGEPIADFKARGRHLVGLWIVTLGGLVAGLAFLALGFGAVFLFNKQMRVRAWDGLFKLGLLGFALLAAGLQGIRRIRNIRGLRVFVFAEGLARVQGESVKILHWPDVATVRHVSQITAGHAGMKAGRKLVLTAADGQHIEFEEGLSGLPQLGELVEQLTLPHLFTPVLDACDEGQEVAFGKVSVSRQALNYGGSQLSWDRCESIEAEQDILIVKAPDARRPFCKVPLNEVPNVHVLIAFAEYIRKYAN